MPSLLFVVLSVINTPLLGLINNLMLYLFSVGLAGILMLVIRSFRQKAFLLEKDLLHTARHDGLTGACSRSYLIELVREQRCTAGRFELGVQVDRQVEDRPAHAPWRPAPRPRRRR